MNRFQALLAVCLCLTLLFPLHIHHLHSGRCDAIEEHPLPVDESGSHSRCADQSPTHQVLHHLLSQRSPTPTRAQLRRHQGPHGHLLCPCAHQLAVNQVANAARTTERLRARLLRPRPRQGRPIPRAVTICGPPDPVLPIV